MDTNPGLLDLGPSDEGMNPSFLDFWPGDENKNPDQPGVDCQGWEPDSLDLGPGDEGKNLIRSTLDHVRRVRTSIRSNWATWPGLEPRFDKPGAG